MKKYYMIMFCFIFLGNEVIASGAVEEVVVIGRQLETINTQLIDLKADLAGPIMSQGPNPTVIRKIEELERQKLIKIERQKCLKGVIERRSICLKYAAYDVLRFTSNCKVRQDGYTYSIGTGYKSISLGVSINSGTSSSSCDLRTQTLKDFLNSSCEATADMEENRCPSMY